MELTTNRLFVICIAALGQAVVLSIIYFEWGRQLVDLIASAFLPAEKCEFATFEENACRKAVVGFNLAQTVGYALFKAIFYFCAAFITAYLLIGRRTISLKNALPLSALTLGGTFLIFWANGLMGPTHAVFNFTALFAGICAAYIWRSRGPHNNSFKADSQPLRGRERP